MSRKIREVVAIVIQLRRYLNGGGWAFGKKKGARLKSPPSMHSVDPLVVRLVWVSEEGNQRQSLGHLPRTDWFSCPESSFLFCPHVMGGGHLPRS